MKGQEQMLFQYMEGSSKRFVIPVYQRNYDWQIEHCKRLYDDLIKVHRENRRSHFFGSIVSAEDDQLGMQEYLIIDGQQRLTTVSLLLLALHDLLEEDRIQTNRNKLTEKIREEYLIDKFTEDETKIKLKPVKDDMRAYMALIDDINDPIKASNLTINYNYFYNRILRQEIKPEELYDAFCRLQIISIYLGRDDNPQLIFESLNSTGLDLSEGDKIRNYILMGVQPTKLQERYYEKYWHKIEQHTNYDVSAFTRDYLSIKTQSTPAMKRVYMKFKDFVATNPFENIKDKKEIDEKEVLLIDLLEYAKRYEILLEANSKIGELDSIIDRLNRFEATVTRPFLMEVIKHEEVGDRAGNRLNESELIEIFEIVESYLFRRQICDIPTNSLKSIFASLNNEIMRYDGTIEDYVEKLKYTLLGKTASRIYPDDHMFAEGLSTKHVYLMQSKNKKYIMERFENWGTKEVKDVWGLIEEGTYTIEHIMPQTLSAAWKEELGPDYEVIHEEWNDKLANLTLTAYNSRYSNRTFKKKRDMENGFRDSGIRMNQDIAQYDKWTAKELDDRNNRLVKQAISIWPMIETQYEPAETVMDSITLEDEISMTGRRISKFSFQGVEQEVSSWVEAYMEIISTLHAENPIILHQLTSAQSREKSNPFVSDEGEGNSNYNKLEDDIYLWVNTNTNTKLSFLRTLFEKYNVENEDLIFYLKDTKKTGKQPSRWILREGFWGEALPIFREKTGRFQNVNTARSNTSATYIGYSGISIRVVANFNRLQIGLNMSNSNKEINDGIFNHIKKEQESIENESKQSFIWENSPEYITSWIFIEYDGIGIEDPSDWQACIDLSVKGINTVSEYLVPIVEDYFVENG